MKAFINGKLYDSETSPIILVFADDNERYTHAWNLSNFTPKEGVRMYAVSKKGQHTPEFIEKLFDKAELKLKKQNG